MEARKEVASQVRWAIAWKMYSLASLWISIVDAGDFFFFEIWPIRHENSGLLVALVQFREKAAGFVPLPYFIALWHFGLLQIAAHQTDLASSCILVIA